MNLTGLDALIEEIIVDAYGEDEQLGAFRQALEDAARMPVNGVVTGEPVLVPTRESRDQRSSSCVVLVRAARRCSRSSGVLPDWLE